MKVNFAMWQKTLNIIPEVSTEEWDQLDLVSRWLISTRVAVLIMTFLSAALAGIFAFRDHAFHFLPWLALTFGLIMAHASNNIFNDYTDFTRGVEVTTKSRTRSSDSPMKKRVQGFVHIYPTFAIGVASWINAEITVAIVIGKVYVGKAIR